MSELRTTEVDDLLRVFAALDDEDTIFSLLEDLFTIREIKETSQRLAVARLLDAGRSLCCHRGGHRGFGHHDRARLEMPVLRRRRLHRRPERPRRRRQEAFVASRNLGLSKPMAQSDSLSCAHLGTRRGCFRMPSSRRGKRRLRVPTAVRQRRATQPRARRRRRSAGACGLCAAGAGSATGSPYSSIVPFARPSR